MQYKSLREQAWECNMELPRRNLVQYTFGNASVIDRGKGVIAIKPSGIDYDKLHPRDIVIVDLENKIVDGKLRPSSDTKTHLVLYKKFFDICGIVHTHSTFSVAWAQAVTPIPILGTTHADHLAKEVPCTRVMSSEMIKGDYEIETGNQILDIFKDISYREIQMVLVACHGPFAWGLTPEKAVYNSVILEELAKMALYTRQINPQVNAINQELIDKHYRRKHGKDSYYGQN